MQQVFWSVGLLQISVLSRVSLFSGNQNHSSGFFIKWCPRPVFVHRFHGQTGSSKQGNDLRGIIKTQEKRCIPLPLWMIIRALYRRPLREPKRFGSIRRSPVFSRTPQGGSFWRNTSRFGIPGQRRPPFFNDAALFFITCRFSASEKYPNELKRWMPRSYSPASAQFRESGQRPVTGTFFFLHQPVHGQEIPGSGQRW